MSDKIVLINQSSGYLMRDVAQALSERYEEVVLLASHPVDGVKTDTIIPYDKRSTLRRLWTWLMAAIQIWWKVTWTYRQYELLIVSNPPFAPLLPLVLGNKFSLLVYDIYPDVLVSQHVLGESNPIVRCWRWANRKVFAKAERIFTIGDGMKQCLSQYTAIEKIKVVPLWPDKQRIRRIERCDNLFVRKHHLEDKFVVMYSGNLGNTHRVEVLLDVAERMADDDGVVFLLVGEGKKKRMLEERVAKVGLRNVLLLPYQPSEMLAHSLSAADIAVVTLDVNSAQMSVPSKTFNLMALGAPLMCIASPDSELGRLVDQYHMGKVFLPEDIDDMLQFISELKNNQALWTQYSRNALTASQNFTSENAKMLVEP